MKSADCWLKPAGFENWHEKCLFERSFERSLVRRPVRYTARAAGDKMKETANLSHLPTTLR